MPKPKPPRRCRLRMCMDILQLCIKKPLFGTPILEKVNLRSHITDELLPLLVTKGFLVAVPCRTKRRGYRLKYSTSTEGYALLMKYKAIRKRLQEVYC